MIFKSSQDSHNHSLTILNMFLEYDDFMESLSSVVDLGCGDGLDTQWWATRTTRDERPVPLNIKAVGVDICEQPPAIIRETRNATYQKCNFEEDIVLSFGKPFDLLWCHDSFQYVINPLQTLAKWRNITKNNGSLVITVPQTTNIEQKHQSFVQDSGSYYHYTLVNLIHMLSVSGWDCSAGYYYKHVSDPWITVIAYRGTYDPLDPRTTTWYDLAEKNVLPESAIKSIMANGYLRQQDLVLPWLDQSLTWFGKY